MKELIKNKYGSIDKMLKETNTFISRSYLYQICNGEKKGLTIKLANELVKLLDLDSINTLMEIINLEK